jgi:hypothetical protein
MASWSSTDHPARRGRTPRPRRLAVFAATLAQRSVGRNRLRPYDGGTSAARDDTVGPKPAQRTAAAALAGRLVFGAERTFHDENAMELLASGRR